MPASDAATQQGNSLVPEGFNVSRRMAPLRTRISSITEEKEP